MEKCAGSVVFCETAFLRVKHKTISQTQQGLLILNRLVRHITWNFRTVVEVITLAFEAHELCTSVNKQNTISLIVVVSGIIL